MRTDKNKFLTVCFNSICVLVPMIILVGILYNSNLFSSILKESLILGTSIFLSISSIYLKYNNKNLFKMFFIINLICLVIFLIYLFGNKYDFLKYLSSPTIIKNFILSTGALGILVFILIQIAQVVCVPIPSVIIVLVGTLIYGPTLCALFCSIGVILGSFISFGIGKSFGKKFVGWIIGKDKLEHYLGIFKGREKSFLCIAFIFPLFPDDILCLVSGISNITFKEFFKITLLTRPIGVIFLCYFGGSFFTQLGGYKIILIVIVAIIIVAATILFFVLKKRRKSVVKDLKVLIKSFSFKKNAINERNNNKINS